MLVLKILLCEWTNFELGTVYQYLGSYCCTNRIREQRISIKQILKCANNYNHCNGFDNENKDDNKIHKDDNVTIIQLSSIGNELNAPFQKVMVLQYENLSDSLNIVFLYS